MDQKEWEGMTRVAPSMYGFGVPPRKLKTPLKTRFAFQVILFQETLEFKFMLWKATIIGLSRSCAKSTSLAIAKIVANTLGPMVQQCSMNQSRGY